MNGQSDSHAACVRELRVRARAQQLLHAARLPAERGEDDGDPDSLHRVQRVREEDNREDDREELAHRLDRREDERPEALDGMEYEDQI